MEQSKQDVRCPWCGETIITAGIKISKIRKDYGTVVERRCPKCSKILAAYLEEEDDYLPIMRTF